MTMSTEEEEGEEWGRWACEVDVVVYKETTTQPLFSPQSWHYDV